MSYEIVRFYEDEDRPSRVLRKGLTLEQAQEHCHDPETSSSTATDQSETVRVGCRWFDGYRETGRR